MPRPWSRAASPIVTVFVRPPIPTRKWDWRATRADYEPGDPIGEGATEAAAIADLLQSEKELDE